MLVVDWEKRNMHSKTRLIIFVATHALLCGCGRLSGPDAGDADAGDRAGPSVRGPEIVRFDGFEGDTVASFWRPGNAGDGRYAPGAVAVSADYARTGTKSVRIIVREGDIEQTGDDGKQTERAELDSGRHALVGRDVWYGFSFLIPPGFPVVDNRLVIAQWKDPMTIYFDNYTLSVSFAAVDAARFDQQQSASR